LNLSNIIAELQTEKRGIEKAIRALAAILLLAAVAWGSDQDWRQHQFSASPDTVYQAAVKVIGLHHSIQSKDPETRTIRFHVGTTAWSWGYNHGPGS
jgi:hypothetical protein